MIALTGFLWFLHWLAVHTGTENESSHYYAFWSGFGSDLGEATLVGGLVVVWRHHVCHDPRCHRLGRHRITVDGVTHLACRHHVHNVHRQATELGVSIKEHQP